MSTATSEWGNVCHSQQRSRAPVLQDRRSRHCIWMPMASRRASQIERSGGATTSAPSDGTDPSHCSDLVESRASASQPRLRKAYGSMNDRLVARRQARCSGLLPAPLRPAAARSVASHSHAISAHGQSSDGSVIGCMSRVVHKAAAGAVGPSTGTTRLAREAAVWLLRLPRSHCRRLRLAAAAAVVAIALRRVSEWHPMSVARGDVASQ